MPITPRTGSLFHADPQLAANAQQIARAVDEGILQEVTYGDEIEAT